MALINLRMKSFDKVKVRRKKKILIENPNIISNPNKISIGDTVIYTGENESFIHKE